MDKNSMLEEMIIYYTNGNKSLFSIKLGVKPQTINTWLNRNTFDAELIYSKCEYISGDWLLSGVGEMIKSTDSHNIQITNSNAAAVNSTINAPQMSTIGNEETHLLAILSEKDKVLEEKEKMIKEKERLIQILLKQLDQK